MFDHHCTACGKRQLIFPTQIASMDNTDHGIVVSFQLLVRRRPDDRHRPQGRPPRAQPSLPDPTPEPAAHLRCVAGFARAARSPYTSPGCPDGPAVSAGDAPP